MNSYVALELCVIKYFGANLMNKNEKKYFFKTNSIPMLEFIEQVT